MSERKMVRRSVAVALGVICVVVIAGLIGAFAYYVYDKNNTISSLNSQISQLNSNATNLQNQNNQLQTQLNGNVSQNANLQGQNNQLQTWLDGNKTDYQNYMNSHSHSDTDYNQLQSIANLGEQQSILNQYTINQGASTHVSVASMQASYAGYLHISLTSTTSNAYVIVEYWFQGRLFSVTQTIGTSGDAYFLLMPSTVTIYAGNANYLNGATDTITATYY